MTLDEAIEHSLEVANIASSEDNRFKHIHLALWLIELKAIKDGSMGKGAHIVNIGGHSYILGMESDSDLYEAIKECKAASEDTSICNGCRNEHKQLAIWLKELIDIRQAIKML